MPAENVGSTGNAGAVVVLHGSPDGLGPDGSQVFTQKSPGIPGAAERGDWFGLALTAGDFDGRRGTDLAIGIPDEDVGAAKDAGGVVVIHQGAKDLVPADSQLWTQNSAGIDGRAEREDRFGAVLAAGNLSGDTAEELAISVTGEQTRAHYGAVQALSGSGRGLSARGDRFLNGADFEGGGQFGAAVTVDDFGATASGAYEDLAIGSPGDEEFDSHSSLFVAYGSRAGVGRVARATLLRDGVDNEPDDQLFAIGEAMTAGDFGRTPGDGYADLAARAAGSDWVESGPGAVHVLYGSEDGVLTAGRQQLTVESVGLPPETFDFAPTLSARGSS